MTPDEVASLYRVPVSTLYGWRYKGEGPPAVRVGRHLRYRRDSVLAWAERGADNSDRRTVERGSNVTDSHSNKCPVAVPSLATEGEARRC